MSYRLSHQAELQLEEIYFYTAQTWDANQAEIYHRQFINSFELLVDFPHAGAPSDEYKPGLRQYRSGKHFIFYSVDEGQILIQYILHTASNIRKHFEA